eukprot:Rmarinus@m.2704
MFRRLSRRSTHDVSSQGRNSDNLSRKGSTFSMTLMQESGIFSQWKPFTWMISRSETAWCLTRVGPGTDDFVAFKITPGEALVKWVSTSDGIFEVQTETAPLTLKGQTPDEAKLWVDTIQRTLGSSNPSVPCDPSTASSTGAESRPSKTQGPTETHANDPNDALPNQCTEKAVFTKEQLVTTTALCVVPPKEVWEPIQRLRRVHDRQVGRWPPHINLVYPSVPEEDFPGVAARLRAELASVRPFFVTLNTLKHFPRARGGEVVVWLQPTTDGTTTDEWVSLAQACRRAIFGSSDTFDGTDFRPHLTVGQFDSETAAVKFIEEVNHVGQILAAHSDSLPGDDTARFAALTSSVTPVSVRFLVSEVVLMARPKPAGADRPKEESSFAEAFRVPLGGGGDICKGKRTPYVDEVPSGARAVPEDIRVTVFLNVTTAQVRSMRVGARKAAALVLRSGDSLADLFSKAEKKMGVSPLRRAFLSTGGEVDCVSELREGDTVFLSVGEEFYAPFRTSVPPTELSAHSAVSVPPPHEVTATATATPTPTPANPTAPTPTLTLNPTGADAETNTRSPTKYEASTPDGEKSTKEGSVAVAPKPPKTPSKGLSISKAPAANNGSSKPKKSEPTSKKLETLAAPPPTSQRSPVASPTVSPAVSPSLAGKAGDEFASWGENKGFSKWKELVLSGSESLRSSCALFAVGDTAQERFANVVTACVLTEPRYGDLADPGRMAVIKLGMKIAAVKPEFLLQTALYIRNVLNLRTTSMFLLAFSAHIKTTKGYLRSYFSDIVRTPRDLLSVVSLYRSMPNRTREKRSFPQCLRKAILARFATWDTYTIAKYVTESKRKADTKRINSRKKGTKGRVKREDVLRSLQDDDDEELDLGLAENNISFKHLIRSLHISAPAEHVWCALGKKYPATKEAFIESGLSGDFDATRAGKRMKFPLAMRWETELPAEGNRKETWQKLLDANKLPYMAMMRNLRNILLVGLDSKYHSIVLRRIVDKQRIAGCRMLPHQFLAAYEALRDIRRAYAAKRNRVLRRRSSRKTFPIIPSEELVSSYRRAVDSALQLAAVHNISPIKGRTIVLIDVGGKMGTPRRKFPYLENARKLAVLLGLLVAYRCVDDCYLRLYGGSQAEECPETVMADVDASKSVLENVEKIMRLADPLTHNMTIFPRGYIDALTRRGVRVDNIVILTGRYEKYDEPAFMSDFESYRRHVNPSLRVFDVDVCGTDTTKGTLFLPDEYDQRHTVHLNAIGDAVLTFIGNSEKAGLVQTIESMQPRCRAKDVQAEVLSDSGDVLPEELSYTHDITDNAPAQFMCPITREVMRDPVVAADGHTYERTAVERWFRRSLLSPLCGLRVPHTRLSPNANLATMIARWRAEGCPPTGQVVDSVLRRDSAAVVREVSHVVGHLMRRFKEMDADSKRRADDLAVKLNDIAQKQVQALSSNQENALQFGMALSDIRANSSFSIQQMSSLQHKLETIDQNVMDSQSKLDTLLADVRSAKLALAVEAQEWDKSSFHPAFVKGGDQYGIFLLRVGREWRLCVSVIHQEDSPITITSCVGVKLGRLQPEAVKKGGSDAAHSEKLFNGAPSMQPLEVLSQGLGRQGNEYVVVTNLEISPDAFSTNPEWPEGEVPPSVQFRGDLEVYLRLDGLPKKTLCVCGRVAIRTYHTKENFTALRLQRSLKNRWDDSPPWVKVLCKTGTVMMARVVLGSFNPLSL